MNRRAIQLVLVAALVAIAGCAGGMGGDLTNDSTTDDSSVTDSSDGGAGTAAFYVSDEPNVIDDFEHLNVTITKVGFKQAGDGDSNETDGDDTNESEDDSTTETDEAADDDESTNETADDGESVNETDEETDDNETDEEEAEEADGNEEEEEEKQSDDDDGDESDGGWVEHDVDNRTVDLTELKGANASMIDEFDLPAGDYEKVFIYVSDTEGILTDGSETNVKLPSNKLQINSKFTIGDGERVDFVYDIAPHKAGNSGKYILKPVISQSGTGDKVEINDIDKDDEAADESEDETDEESEEEADEEETGDEEETQADDEQQANETDGNETTAEMALLR
ncbi:DUF4382 domain-containing protein [Natrinema salsiterrestre]|uniref:DUF4382 domain-containing protein n=1 Tax=Natrinema salsiterrestre TaxID=2950540 RepID=A0A9Q4L8N0_9EURY|nr:DUF4382 domain-containing protein [Natrinema salsiterrestre]MDF9747266.1 DUF4382 domain-containing protein [Natrinema salsiterrestre]